MVLGLWKKLRRGRDSNSRRTCILNGFRDRPIQPLWHLSKICFTNFGNVTPFLNYRKGRTLRETTFIQKSFEGFWPAARSDSNQLSIYRHKRPIVHDPRDIIEAHQPAHAHRSDPALQQPPGKAVAKRAQTDISR